MQCVFFFFFFKQKTAYEMQRGLVGSEMCIRDRYQRRVHGGQKLRKKQHFILNQQRTLNNFMRPFLFRLRNHNLQRNQHPLQIADGCQSYLRIQKLKANSQPRLRKKYWKFIIAMILPYQNLSLSKSCLLYTSDAADDTPCVDLGGRRIIKKKKKKKRRLKEKKKKKKKKKEVIKKNRKRKKEK
eukprot:TRINITY_DN8222_c0_g1_i10.p1 TRINITY_DN8222_c0_g1~~TRINITY_DN8222_c0_g1_i10.p1  ORF type:complete len:184 (-),score=72.14 TRINITY_DN8222_c0_g1_i10:8-559(-)